MELLGSIYMNKLIINSTISDLIAFTDGKYSILQR